MSVSATKPKYRVNFNDVPEIFVEPVDPKNTAPFRAKKVSAAQGSIMMAERGAGYHTKPHIHDCEQWNYIVAGEIWFFVEDHGYRCRKGDVMRIPRDRPHWAYNRSDGDCTVLEFHAPPLIENRNQDKVVWLLDDTEDRATIVTEHNRWVEFDQQKVDDVEARAFAEEG